MYAMYRKHLLFMLVIVIVSAQQNDRDTLESDGDSSKAKIPDQGFKDIPFDEDKGAYDFEPNLGFVFGSEEYSEPEDDRRVLKPVDTALAAVYGIITIVGLIFNAVVFFVIFGRNEISKTVTAIYVVQLALADSIFLFSLPIFGMQKVTGSWSFGSATCTICQTVKFLNYYAGIFFLTAMSIDRYVAVAYSSRAHQLRTTKRTFIVCGFVWAISGIMAFPIALYSKIENVSGTKFCRLQFPGYQAFNFSDSFVFVYIDEEYDDYSEGTEDYASGDYSGSASVPQSIEDNKTSVEINQELEDHIDREREYTSCMHDTKFNSFTSWLITNFVMAFLIPFLVISVSYILILLRLRTSEEKVASMTGKRTMNMRKRVTRMVAALVICFAICWLPYNIFLLVKINGLNVTVTTCDAMEQFFIALGFANSAVNPILYTFLGHNFKQRFRESINHTKRKLRRGSIASGSGHITRSNSDHGNISLTKRIGNLVGLRRPSKPSSGCENDCSNERNSRHSLSGKRSKYGIPLLDLSKRREQKSGWKYESEQNVPTDCLSRTQSNQTECTRIMLDRETKNDGPDIFVK